MNMDIIDKVRLFVPKRRRRLWHYTSCQGMVGIIMTRKIWATDILYLNDRLEYKLAVDLVLNELNQPGVLCHYDKEERTYLKSFCAYLQGVPGGDTEQGIYVCSFSSQGDDRVAWEIYGDHGRGYCIGFDYQDLRESLKQHWWLVPCYYTSRQHSKIIRCFLRKAIHLFRTKQATSIDTCRASILAEREAFCEFLQIAPLLKHSSWVADREWRLISKPNAHITPLRRKPRRESYGSGNTEIPYIEIELEEKDKPLRIP